MLDKIKSWVHNCLSETDNKTICPIRVLAFIGTMQGLGMQAWDVIGNHVAFNLEQFGIGMGAMLGSLGLALGFKKDTKKEGE